MRRREARSRALPSGIWRSCFKEEPNSEMARLLTNSSNCLIRSCGLRPFRISARDFLEPFEFGAESISFESADAILASAALDVELASTVFSGLAPEWGETAGPVVIQRPRTTPTRSVVRAITI